MRKTLQKAIKKASTFEDVLQITVGFISTIKNENSNIKIGYVAGKVTADGVNNIPKNLKRLHKFTNKLTKIHGDYIFSAADVFNDEVYWKINIAKPVHEEDFYKFWREIIESGITDIYMTPEWERSDGARDEHKRARELGITVHYVVEEKLTF